MNLRRRRDDSWKLGAANGTSAERPLSWSADPFADLDRDPNDIDSIKIEEWRSVVRTYEYIAEIYRAVARPGTGPIPALPQTCELNKTGRAAVNRARMLAVNIQTYSKRVPRVCIVVKQGFFDQSFTELEAGTVTVIEPAWLAASADEVAPVWPPDHLWHEVRREVIHGITPRSRERIGWHFDEMRQTNPTVAKIEEWRNSLDKLGTDLVGEVSTIVEKIMRQSPQGSLVQPLYENYFDPTAQDHAREILEAIRRIESPEADPGALPPVATGVGSRQTMPSDDRTDTAPPIVPAVEAKPSGSEPANTVEAPVDARPDVPDPDAAATRPLAWRQPARLRESIKHLLSKPPGSGCTVADCSAATGIPAARIYRWIEDRTIKATRDDGAHHSVDVASLGEHLTRVLNEVEGLTRGRITKG